MVIKNTLKNKSKMNLKPINIYPLINKVRKPAQYIGGELNCVHKDIKKCKASMILAFPDLYEIGMSSMAIHILYNIINNHPGFVVERVFSPWLDMEEQMRTLNIPLFSLESRLPIKEFDILGFSIQHELCFTNILNMLNLAKIPINSKDRGEEYPIIIAGGPGVFNPEPMSPFIDFFVIGDGEKVVIEILKKVAKLKNKGFKKTEIIKEIGQIDGIYIPEYYDFIYETDGRLKEINVKNSFPKKVVKNIYTDFDNYNKSMKLIVPNTKIVHDRFGVEIMRGCSRGCRFCLAGSIYKPVREQNTKSILKLIKDGLANTGYDEISLSSLSSTDYSQIDYLLKNLRRNLSDSHVAISLPSLRCDSFSVKLANLIGQERKTGLTFAPETGTQRLRDVINKDIKDEDIFECIRAVFSSGWEKIKLYFMIGLPTEKKEDLDGIVSIINRVLKIAKYEVPKNKWHRVKINVNISPFCPKSHTPFQWVGQDLPENLNRKIDYLRSKLKSKKIFLKIHDIKMSQVEAVLARGDRRVSKAIEIAWELGCKFDSWTEKFSYDRWTTAFKKANIDIQFYANRQRDDDEIFPWETISTGQYRKFLFNEYKKALKGKTTPDCRFVGCINCGLQEITKCPTLIE